MPCSTRSGAIPASKYRQVLGLGAPAEDLLALARGIHQLQALLADARTARVIVVTRAAVLPRLETTRLLARLSALGMTASAVVVNAVTPSALDGTPAATRAEAAEIRVLRGSIRARRGDPAFFLTPAPGRCAGTPTPTTSSAPWRSWS